MRRAGSTARARCLASGTAGGLLAFVVFAWFALGGHLDPLRSESLGNFYEVQARSWLHGRWDAGPGDYIFERFNVGGRFYTYFGPAPALLRLPFVLFTESLDGRLSRLSMMLAFAVLLGGATALAWQARRVVRGDGMPTRTALLATAGFVFLSGCGTTALFLGAKTWVYHEAILWGSALAITSFSFLVAYLLDPRASYLAGASLTAALSFLSRGSVGIGPVAALAVLLGVRFVTWVSDHVRRGEHLRILGLLGLGPTGEDPKWWPVAVAVAVPIALYAYVNHVKFGTFFGTPPYELQDELAARPSRQAALAANHGSLFGLHYAPTILLAYFRPDGLRFDRLFPWVSFAGPPRVIGSSVFEAANFSASITVTSLVFMLLGGLGIWATVRGRRPSTASPDAPAPSVAVFRVPILAAGAGCLGMVMLAFLEERYLGDIVPLLVVASAPGLWWVARLLDRRGPPVRALAITALALVGAWSLWTTASLTLLEQRAFGPLVATRTRAEFIDVQTRIHQRIPGGEPSGVRRGTLPLPAPARAGTMLVVGHCDGLYWSNGRFWHPVEQTPRTGRFPLRLRLEPLIAGSSQPVLSATDARGTSVLWAKAVGEHRIKLQYQWTGENQTLIEGVAPDAELIGQRTSPAVHVTPERPLRLGVRLDPAGYVGVRSRGRVLLSTFAPVATTPATIGTEPLRGTALRGTVAVGEPGTPICDRLTSGRRDHG